MALVNGDVVNEIRIANSESEIIGTLTVSNGTENGFVYIDPIISGEYVKPDGSFEAYSGWSRSDYIYIKGAETLIIDMPRSGRSLGFYDSTHVVTEMRLDLPAGTSTLTIPDGTSYFAISEDDSNIIKIRYKSPEYRYLSELYKNGIIQKVDDIDNGWTTIKDVVHNSYVKNDGTFESYAGWTRSVYIDCRNIDSLAIYMPRAGRTIAFYDAAFTFEYTQTSVAGVNVVDVPVGSAYFALSEDDAYFYDIKYKLPSRTYADQLRAGRGAKHIKLPSEIRSISRLGYDAGGTYPEQTLAAYKEAVRRGFKILLCDLSFTSDDVAVCIHDKTINRTARTSGGGRISQTIDVTESTYNTISQYDYGRYISNDFIGERLLTLDEFLQFAKGVGAEVYIEMKYCSKRVHAQYAVDIVKNHHMQNNVSWSSFYASQYGQMWYLSRIIENDPGARVGLMTAQGGSVTADYKAALLALQTDCNEIYAFNWASDTVSDQDAEWYTSNNVAYEAGTLDSEQDIITYYNKPNIAKIISGIETSKFVASDVIKNYLLS